MKLCKHEDCAKQSTHIYEKKDACYTKVKSRYDVWPSAYASGALVKCRKVGAKNWGNSKKESVDEAVYQFKRYTNTQMDELDAELHRGGFRGTPDLNKMTYTTDEISSKLDKIIKSKGGKKIKESVNEAKYKGYDYKRQNRKDGLPLIVPALRKTFANMKDLKKYIDKHGTMEGVNESVNEGKLSEDYKNSEWEVYVADENGKEKIVKKAKSKRAGVILYNKLINSDNYYEVGMRVVKESVDEGMTKQQADVTLKQLGANKFIAMTGAKQFSFGKQGLGFRIGKNSKSINYVRVDLKSNDLYDMEFIRIRGSKIKVVKKVTGVYNDQLQKIFTKHTGLYTSL